MTNEEKLVWKTKVLGEMKEHLKAVTGYPNCSSNDIMYQVPYMWNILVAKQLIPAGMTYGMFIHFANESYMKAEVNRIIGL